MSINFGTWAEPDTHAFEKTREAVPQVTNVNKKTSVFHVTSPHLTKSKSLQGRPVRHQVPKAFSLAELFDGREIHPADRPKNVEIANAKWLKHIARWDRMNEGRSLDAKQIKLIKQRKDHANCGAKPSTCCGECATQRTCLISHPIKRLYQARRKHIAECTWKVDLQGDVTSTSGPTTSTHTYHDTHTPSNGCSDEQHMTTNNDTDDDDDDDDDDNIFLLAQWTSSSYSLVFSTRSHFFWHPKTSWIRGHQPPKEPKSGFRSDSPGIQGVTV